MRSHPKRYTQAGTRVEVHVHSGQMPQRRLPTRQGHRSPPRTAGQTLCALDVPCPGPSRPILSDTDRLPSPWKPPPRCRYRTQHHRSLLLLALCPSASQTRPRLSGRPPSCLSQLSLAQDHLQGPSGLCRVQCHSRSPQHPRMSARGALMRPRPTFPGYTKETEVQGEGTCPQSSRMWLKPPSGFPQSQAGTHTHHHRGW